MTNLSYFDNSVKSRITANLNLTLAGSEFAEPQSDDPLGGMMDVFSQFKTNALGESFIF